MLDRNGNIVLNEAGDPIYKKDLKGERIQNGWTWYSLVSHQRLQQIQEKNQIQSQIDDLTCVMADVIGGVQPHPETLPMRWGPASAGSMAL